MRRLLRLSTIASFLLIVTGMLRAQFTFTVDGHDFQVHSFASQGFLYSDQNNYLTMPTSTGSFGLTDFGGNIAVSLTDNLRVGAQIYDYHAGQLGRWHPELDWAVVDYRFKPWFGVRGGKVKTTLGLYGENQDLEFLHTWALLPQSVYPLDLRGETIAHIGGDVYGKLDFQRMGTLRYTGYAGKLLNDPYGGYSYGISGISGSTFGTSFSLSVNDFTQFVKGTDLRWSTPVKGLLLGASGISQQWDISETIKLGPVSAPVAVHSTTNHTLAYYAQYTLGGLELSGEYRRALQTLVVRSPMGTMASSGDNREGFVSASYRICKWLQIGTYHSRFYVFSDQPISANGNHVFDQAVTARFDLNHLTDLKIEEHFMDGYGNSVSYRGFYPQVNPAGLAPKTDLLIVRLGFHM